jgi:Type III secretion protein YscO
MLDQLLRIKQLRETGALNDMKIKSLAFEQSVRLAKEADKQLSDYIGWREGEERRLFKTLQDKLVPLVEIEKHNQKVGLLRDRDAQLEQAIQQAELNRKKAKQALQQAKALHNEAIKTVEKYSGLVSDQQQAQAKHAQLREELELEEFNSPRLE